MKTKTLVIVALTFYDLLTIFIYSLLNNLTRSSDRNSREQADILLK